MELACDAKARRLLGRCRPGQAVLVTILGNYGLPGATLTAEWCSAAQAERDPDLVRLGVQQGTPIYAHRRIATFARWHPVSLTARGLAWWPSPAVAHAGDVWHELVRWESTHPGLCSYRHVPAA